MPHFLCANIFGDMESIFVETNVHVLVIADFIQLCGRLAFLVSFLCEFWSTKKSKQGICAVTMKTKSRDTLKQNMFL